jgi:hypothetical protein
MVIISVCGVLLKVPANFSIEVSGTNVRIVGTQTVRMCEWRHHLSLHDKKYKRHYISIRWRVDHMTLNHGYPAAVRIQYGQPLWKHPELLLKKETLFLLLQELLTKLNL